MRIRPAGWAVWLGAWLACAAYGQVTDVRVEAFPDDVGLGGWVQPGQWTPIMLQMTNQSAQLRPVVARWLVSDVDGDAVYAERTAPLNPGVTQKLWLYAPLPVGRPAERWFVQVLDAESRQELSRLSIAAPNAAGLTETLIGVCGSVDMGLREYEPGYTQHEPTRFVRGLTLANLPDRWYGLSTLHALIWTGESGDAMNDPLDASFTAQTAESLRQWVRRGGHLVLVLPMDQTWSDSPLADLMPVAKQRITRVEDFEPAMLGALPAGRTGTMIPALTFQVAAQDGVMVLAKDRQQRPYAVAKRYGFGRVTAIGVDLTHAEVRRLGIPNGQQRIWNRVFNWAAPVISAQVYESEVSEGKMLGLGMRSGRGTRLDAMIGGMTAMTGTAAPALLSAILIFALYWVVAGPLAYVTLKRRGQAHHAWLAFVAMAGLFTAITWGGAWIIRPAHTRLEHVSFLDIDANAGLVHTRSRFTLLVPRFGQASVAVDPDNTFDGHTLAAAGNETGSPGGEFLDPQEYVLNVADPRDAAIPVRSTTKAFAMDYLGRLDPTQTGVADDWGLPMGTVRMDEQNAWPVARLTHSLPGEALKNVLVIFCPGTLTAAGEMQPPWVGFVEQWPAGQPLQLSSPPGIAMTRLYARPPLYVAQRLWETEGYLGQLVARHKGRPIDPNLPGHVESATEMPALQWTMLSFFDAMPPPDFRDASLAGSLVSTHYERTLLRDVDLTPLLAGRRLILLGQLENVAVPAPLTLDGDPVPARGLTLVRWVYDL